MNKREACRAHAKKRASQRYGLMLNRDDLNLIGRAIRSGDPRLAQFVKASSHTRTVWKICMNGNVIPVVYDKLRHVVVSFLPPEYLERHSK